MLRTRSARHAGLFHASLALVALSVQGCWELDDRYHVFQRVTVGNTGSWSVPGTLPQPDGGLQLAVSVHGEFGSNGRLSLFDAGSANHVLTIDQNYDIAAIVWYHDGPLSRSPRLILEGRFGVWSWPDAPEYWGWASGFAVGFGAGPVSVQFARTWLHDVAGGATAKLTGGSVSLYFSRPSPPDGNRASEESLSFSERR